MFKRSNSSTPNFALNSFGALLLCGALGFAAPQVVQAAPADKKSKQETNSTERLSISHRQPKVQDIPYPGQVLNLIVQVANTKKTDMDVKLYATHDGRAIELQALPGYLDRYDVPTYEIPIHAPKFNLSYQFVLNGKDGEAITASKRYLLQRSCLPNLNLAEPEISKEITGEARLDRVSAEVENLQNDLDGFRRVREILDNLAKEIKFLDEAQEK